jgi:hypothetical protein
MLLLPDWDTTVKQTWHEINNLDFGHVKVVQQLKHGGIKNVEPQARQFAGNKCRIGKLGGSGFWSVRPNFFEDVGFLDIKDLVGRSKKHDQDYWILMDRKAKGKPYNLGINKYLILHCGKFAGSVCNRLTRNPGANISFAEGDRNIESMSFEEFYAKARGLNYEGEP